MYRCGTATRHSTPRWPGTRKTKCCDLGHASRRRAVRAIGGGARLRPIAPPSGSGPRWSDPLRNGVVRGHCFSCAHAAPLELPKGRAACISRATRCTVPARSKMCTGPIDPLDVLRGITERGALPRCSYHRDHPARVSTAVGRALASQYNFISAAPPSAGSAHGGRAYRPKCAAEEVLTAWLSVLGAAAVRRGSYPPALGAWRAEWCQSSVRRHAAVDHKLAAGHPRSFV